MGHAGLMHYKMNSFPGLVLNKREILIVRIRRGTESTCKYDFEWRAKVQQKWTEMCLVTTSKPNHRYDYSASLQTI